MNTKNGQPIDVHVGQVTSQLATARTTAERMSKEGAAILTENLDMRNQMAELSYDAQKATDKK
jgi:hypothetical protein